MQNSALRIALGVYKTSQIHALNVEANIPPLNLHFQELTLKYYVKLMSVKDHPTKEILTDDGVKHKNWTSGAFKVPFCLKAKGIARWWEIIIKENSASVISPIPTWKKIDLEIHLELKSKTEPADSDEVINGKFMETVEAYGNANTDIHRWI